MRSCAPGQQHKRPVIVTGLSSVASFFVTVAQKERLSDRGEGAARQAGHMSIAPNQRCNRF